jgi:hypothetical protein
MSRPLWGESGEQTHHLRITAHVDVELIGLDPMDDDRDRILGRGRLELAGVCCGGAEYLVSPRQRPPPQCREPTSTPKSGKLPS